MRAETVAALALALLLSACGEAGGTVHSTPKVATTASHQTPRKSKRPPPRMAIQPVAGLEGVMGANSAELTRMFGQPRLDVWEGDAHKLQFSGTPCVLDVWLYPAAEGREPQASYVEARRATDGKDVDRATCVAALRRPSR
jgi:hypothetical protein